MKVSIVIPVYNRARVLPRTLESVARQTYRPLEVVLVDNNSIDNSSEVIHAFADSHNDLEVKLLSETTPGACAARNTGFGSASGDWVMFFDSDDAMSPDHVQRMATAAENHPEAQMIAWPRRLVDPDGSEEVKPVRPADVIANHLLHSTLPTQAWAARRDWLAEAPLWDESLPAWNDYEYALRLLLRRPAIVWLDGEVTVTVYSSGAESITGTGFSDRHGYWESVLDKMQAELENADIDGRTRLLRIVDFRRLTLAAIYHREGHPDLAEPLRDKALEALSHKWLTRLTMPRLYRRIASGARGSARLARLLIR